MAVTDDWRSVYIRGDVVALRYSCLAMISISVGRVYDSCLGTFPEVMGGGGEKT